MSDGFCIYALQTRAKSTPKNAAERKVPQRYFTRRLARRSSRFFGRFCRLSGQFRSLLLMIGFIHHPWMIQESEDTCVARLRWKAAGDAQAVIGTWEDKDGRSTARTRSKTQHTPSDTTSTRNQRTRHTPSQERDTHLLGRETRHSRSPPTRLRPVSRASLPLFPWPGLTKTQRHQAGDLRGWTLTEAGSPRRGQTWAPKDVATVLGGNYLRRPSFWRARTSWPHLPARRPARGASRGQTIVGPDSGRAAPGLAGRCRWPF